MRVLSGYASAQALILIAGFIDELIENALVVVAVLVREIANDGLKHHGDQIKRRIAPDRGVDGILNQSYK